MADDSGYTTITHGMPIGVFLAMIEGNIKNHIRKYGHKNCGLRHEELCEEIKKIISDNRKIVFKHMNQAGRKKWISDWDSKRNEFFNRLFEEEGFINVCYPKNYKNNPSLYELKSKHIQFCKERDVRREAVIANPLYSECVNYNSWINTETTKLILEFLRNVKISKLPTVKKYFSTKTQPEGYDPRDTYPKSKLDCNEYNPPPRSHPQRPTAETPPNSIHSHTITDVTQRSKEKNRKSVPDVDSENDKKKPDENMSHKPKPSTAGSKIPSSTTIEPDHAVNGEKTNVKAKGPVPPIKGEGEKKEGTSRHLQQPTDSTPPKGSNQTQRNKTPPQAQILPPSPNYVTLTPVIQHVSSSTGTTSLSSTLDTVKDTTSSQTTATSSTLTKTLSSSLNLGLPATSDPLPPAVLTKDQDRTLHSTTPVTSANTHSTQILPAPSAAVPSLAPLQTPTINTPPTLTSAHGPTTPASSSASTVTATVTITTAAPATVTIPTVITTQHPTSSLNQAPGINRYQEPPPLQAASEPKATELTTEPQQTVIHPPTSFSGRDNGGISVPTLPGTIDNNPQTTLSSIPSPKTDNSIKQPGIQLTNSITPHSVHTPSGSVVLQGDKLQKTVGQADPKHNTSPVQIGNTNDNDKLTTHLNTYPGKIPEVKPGKDLNNNPVTQKGKNDNPRIIPEGIPPLMYIIPTLLVILATLTLLFQLYKYTPFGFLLGRRRKRKKQNLKRIFEIPEKRTYEYPNITMHEWEDHNLGGKTVENDAYIKLLKINRYKQEMEKSKKKNKTTLIEVHMEVLEENKKDEWELHKRDFLEICLRGFMNEENETYQKFANSELIVNNIKNEKTIEDIQKQQNLWNS
ncbi:STP1 protein [Plasmodium ovale curtisi]|uniref:STP1 protein n=1 Tax=Plasmodium ovale curtisi TaxID=864141 RepID=A0A1A8WIN7_PLAOA|nr:STP1 protein [Plasmodium ovale curtisi]